MLAVLSLSMMIIGLDNTIVNVALPTLQGQFNASASNLQWIVDAYLLVFAAALLTMGTIGDRYGSKRALQGGLILFGSASAAVVFAGSVNHLIALRILMGLGAAFIAWERRVASPMLNLTYFRNPRFSLGSLSISVIFFSLMAAIFGLTQYLQFAHGYSALKAGATMIPLAIGLMLSATTSSRLVTRFGTKRVVAVGMVLLALVLSATVFWTPAQSVWLIVLWLFVLGLAMGSVMAPATDSVMGSVPPAKAGVASAMNDVTRQVGGALGVAIVGSLINTIYTSRIGDTAAALPAKVQ